MADPLDNANDILQELRDAALHTTAGSFVRVEHVERLLKERREARISDAEARLEEPPPKTLQEARRRAARDLKEAIREQDGAPRYPEPGKSVDASPPAARA